MKRTNDLKPVTVGTTYQTVYGDRATVVSLEHALPAYVVADVPNPFRAGLVCRVAIRSDNLLGYTASA